MEGVTHKEEKRTELRLNSRSNKGQLKILTSKYVRQKKTWKTENVPKLTGCKKYSNFNMHQTLKRTQIYEL